MRKARDNSTHMIIKIISLSILIVCGVVYSVRKICSADNEVSIPIHSVDTSDKKLSLSFNTSLEDPSSNIEQLLDVLDKHNAKSTFFVTGQWVDNNKDLANEISKRGHELGNYSDTHTNPAHISDESIIEEIQSAKTKIKEVTNVDTVLYRPPYSDVNEDVIRICDSLDHTVVKWDIDSLDWKQIGHTHIVDRVNKSINSGSIVLFHTSENGIAKYVDEILTNLSEDEYEVITISDLLYDNNYIVDEYGKQKKVIR